MSPAAAEFKTTIGLVQMACGTDREANIRRAETMVREAGEAGAGIVCLPELFATRYICQTEDADLFALAEPVPGATTHRLAKWTAELGIVLIASLFERRAPGVYHNTAAVFDAARGLVAVYRKMHIPDDPRYHEKFYFTPGDLGFRAVTTSRGRIAPLVCWDQWYPEAARLVALQGAEILFYPTAIGWHPEEKEELGAAQHAAWETVHRAHAICNGCFVAAANRLGFEPEPGSPPEERRGIEFWGQSLIVAPDGSVIARAGAEEERILTAELDLAAIETARTGWPFLRDRRIDAYEGLLRRFDDDPPV